MWAVQGIGPGTGSRNPANDPGKNGTHGKPGRASWAKDKAYITSEVNTIEPEGL